MRAIDDDLQPVETQAAREARFDEFDIAAAGIVETLGAAELLRRRALARGVADLRLDRGLDLVRELVAVGAEEFDAVILERIVRGRDHRRRDRRASDRVSMAIAGVGSGPTSTTSMPMAMKPEVSAGSSI